MSADINLILLFPGMRTKTDNWGFECKFFVSVILFWKFAYKFSLNKNFTLLSIYNGENNVEYI